MFCFVTFMNKYSENRSMKDMFILVLLLTLIFARFYLVDENNTFVNSVGYIGVLLALFNLYLDAHNLFVNNDKFHIVRGATYILCIPLTIILVFFLTGVMPIDSKWSDSFTFLALLVSLPSNLYLSWIEKGLKKRRK